MNSNEKNEYLDKLQLNIHYQNVLLKTPHELSFLLKVCMNNYDYKFSSSQAGDLDELDQLVRGKGCYTSDISLPGQQYGCFVRSTHANAKIISVDVKDALSINGVSCALTGADIFAAGLGKINPLVITKGSNGEPMVQSGIPVLAHDFVRFVGEPIALVVADSPAKAMLASERVLVDYLPLPAVVKLQDAIHSESPNVHAHMPNNLVLEWAQGGGVDMDKAFKEAVHIESIELEDPMLTGSPMEPRAVIASWDAQRERYVLIASTQGVKNIQNVLANHVFNLPIEKFRVLTPHVGGGFGLKSQTYPEMAALLLASKRIGLPIKWTASRLECFLTDTHGRNTLLKGRMAFDADGLITAFDADLLVGVGAYTSGYIGVVSTSNIYNCLSSVYRIPNLKMRSRLVHTNVMPAGPYRGAGRPEAIYLVERLIDQAARSMSMDRVSLRRKNFVPVDAMPYLSSNQLNYDSGEFEIILDKALLLSDWTGFKDREALSKKNGRMRGIGVCSFLEVAGGVLEEPADLKFTEDGKVALYLGAQGMGQGIQAIYPKLVAKKLGISLSDIVLISGDSDLVPGTVPTVASRTTMMAGSATLLACEESIRRGQLLAGHFLEASTDDLMFEDGKFKIAGTDIGISLIEIAEKLRKNDLLPLDIPNSLDNTSHFKAPSMNFPNGCHVSEVEIDPNTGEIFLLTHTAVDDVGVMLNPTLVEGQIMGGIAQALGQVMGEVLSYDAEGQLLTASYMDYPMPRADMMPKIVLGHHEVPCTTHPLGVKGAGESGVAGAWPATVNAILHALGTKGVRHMDIPFTPNRVWSALHNSQE